MAGAVRNGDHEKAVRLSQVRERAKKLERRYGKCPDCNITIAKKSTRCWKCHYVWLRTHRLNLPTKINAKSG
jgi:hypothetical protein